MSKPVPFSVETFFGTPRLCGARISPDGLKVAFLAPWRGYLNIWLCDSDAPVVSNAVRLTSDDRRNIDSFQWSADSRFILFVQDSAGDENWHLYRIDLAAEKVVEVDLTPFPGVRVTGFELSLTDPGKVYVQMNARRPELIDVYEIDIATGKVKTIGECPDRYVAWLIVPGGPLHAMLIDEQGDQVLARYDSGQFVRITSFSGRDYPLGALPVIPTPDGRSVWMGVNTGTDRTRLARIDLATGAETEIDSHPHYSLDTPRPEADLRFPSSLITNPVTRRLLGARYLGQRQVIHAIDPCFAPVLTSLQGLSTAELGFVSCDAQGRRWVVEFTDDRHPGSTWIYDHETGAARMVGQRFPQIPVDRLAAVRPVTVTSRDGLSLPCHVTLPPMGGDGPWPTVLLVHGGPWHRDACVYDPEVQFLASQGYAVLQVNFRGSTGYGKSFMQAAEGEFAGRMHDDLLDGLAWAIAEGITDASRVVIYGCSYGGYAALVGASFTPQHFAAAISYSGMSDLRQLVEGAVPFVRPALVNNYLRYIGDPAIPEQNADMLARSPVSRLDHIDVPLLVIHGANDVRVAQQQADAVVESLRARGSEVEYLLNPHEGHWFINQDSNIELYHRIARFLARHVGGSGTKAHA